MPEDWTITTCPGCSQQFKAPNDLEAGDAIACPACGEEIITEAPAQESSLSPLPPRARKTVDLDLPEMMIKEANPAVNNPLPDIEDAPSGPKLDNISAIKKSEDLEPLVEDAPQERVMRTKDRQQIVGWDEQESRHEGIKFTTLLKFLLFAVPLICGAIFLATKVQSKREKEDNLFELPEGSAEIVLDDSNKPESVVPLLEKSSSVEFYDTAMLTLENFLNAPDTETRAKFVRDPQRVRPLMEQYYQTHSSGPISFKSLPTKETTTIAKGFHISSITRKDFTVLPVVMARAPNEDRLVVDWESFVGYNEMSFAEFREQRPTSPTLFRVRAKFDDYYNFDFDEKTYGCLQLGDLELTEAIYGYIERGSELWEKMYLDLVNARVDFMILKLAFPEDPKSPNQVFVDDYITAGWMLEEAL